MLMTNKPVIFGQDINMFMNDRSLIVFSRDTVNVSTSNGKMPQDDCVRPQSRVFCSVRDKRGDGGTASSPPIVLAIPQHLID